MGLMARMPIHVARNSAQLGIFSAEEIQAGLQAGRFSPTDLAWREGMAGWTPLGEWAEFRASNVPISSSNQFSAEAPVQPMPAWERGPSLAHFFQTIRDVALNPVRTFDALPIGGFAKPITFTYWASLPAVLLGTLIYGLLFSLMGDEILRPLKAAGNMPAFLNDVSTGAVIILIGVGLGLLFLLIPLSSMVGAALTHLLLLPWGPQGTYRQTYRATSYAQAAFFPFIFIPCLNYVAGPWQVVAIVIGLSRVHKIEWWKVLISTVVVPCCCACFGYAALFAMLAKSWR